MRSRAFTLVEVLLVLMILGLLLAFALPNFGVVLKRRSLTESTDRLQSLIVMAHARAMQDGLKYRIMFPGTPDPNDKLAEKEIEIPFETQQPNVERQIAPLENPDWFGGFEAGWKSQAILQPGTRCVAVLPGRPNFDISPDSPIAGPSILEGQAPFVPLTLNPDGTTEWVTFVLTDLPFDVELEPYHVGRILNVMVDGRTGQTWVQRALRVEEVEAMQELGASPVFHQNFTNPEMMTVDAIETRLRERTGYGWEASARMKRGRD